MDLKIDPEFESKIPPLSEAEFKQLEENILADGEIYEPIITWNGTIIDGHNRWRILQKHEGLLFRTKEMDFPGKWEAFDWMYKNQLGRRNLTDEQRTYLLGKQYEARKHTHGGDRHSDDFSRRQNGALSGRVREHIMKEQGVGQKTVERSEYYAHGIDAIRESDPELADSILKSETKVPKIAIQEIGTVDFAKRIDMIQAVKEGKRARVESEKPKATPEEKKARKEELDKIAAVAAEMFAPSAPVEYNITSLLDDIKINSAPFIRLLTQMVTMNKEICTEHKAEVIKAIHENTILKIEEINKEIESYE